MIDLTNPPPAQPMSSRRTSPGRDVANSFWLIEADGVVPCRSERLDVVRAVVRDRLPGLDSNDSHRKITLMLEDKLTGISQMSVDLVVRDLARLS